MQASLTYMATPEVIGVNCKFQAFSARSLQGLCKASARSPHTVLKPASLNSARRYLLAPRVQGLCDFLFNVLVYSPECAVALPATEFVASLTSFAKRVLLGAAARIAVAVAVAISRRSFAVAPHPAPFAISIIPAIPQPAPRCHFLRVRPHHHITTFPASPA